MEIHSSTGLSTGSLRYELYHRENQQWLAQLQFFKNEMVYFEKWLTQLAMLNLPICVQNKRLSLLEQLIQQKYACIELTNAIKHEVGLFDLEVKEKDFHLNEEHYKKHRSLRTRLHTLALDFWQTRHTFYECMSDLMD